MSKTYRKIIFRKTSSGTFPVCLRLPKYKHKLIAGESDKQVTTDWDDKPIAAIKERKHKLCAP